MWKEERETEGRRRMMAREMGSFFASFLFLLDDVPPLLSRRHLSFWPEKGRKQYEMAVRKRSASLFFVCLSVCVLVPFLLIWSSSAFSFFSFSLPLCTWVGGWVGAARLLLSLATDNPSCSVVDVGNRRSSLRARKRVGTLVVVVVVVCNHATFLSFPFFFIHPPSGRRGGGDGEPVAPVGWNQSIIVNESSRNESFKGKREEKEARWMDGWILRPLLVLLLSLYLHINKTERRKSILVVVWPAGNYITCPSLFLSVWRLLQIALIGPNHPHLVPHSVLVSLRM